MNEAELAKIFKALSNEQRLKIFRMLCKWYEDDKAGIATEEELGALSRCFTRTCCTISLSKSTISHHFKELQNAGLISIKRQGQCYQCTINYEAVNAVRDFLNPCK